MLEDVPEDQRAHFGLAEVRRLQSRFDEAIDIWRRAYTASGDDTLDEIFETARGRVGFGRLERAIAGLELTALTERSRSGAYVSPMDFARAYVRLGQSERAFTYFDAAFTDRAASLVFLKVVARGTASGRIRDSRPPSGASG